MRVKICCTASRSAQALTYGGQACLGKTQPSSPKCVRSARLRLGRPNGQLVIMTAIHCACASICQVIPPALNRACRSGSFRELRLQGGIDVHPRENNPLYSSVSEGTAAMALAPQ